MCGPRRAKNNSSCAAFRCAMARERDRAPQIRTTAQTISMWEWHAKNGIHYWYVLEVIIQNLYNVLHRLKIDTGGKPGVWRPQWRQDSGTAIKAQHGSLAKMNNGRQFGCSACWGRSVKVCRTRVITTCGEQCSSDIPNGSLTHPGCFYLQINWPVCLCCESPQ